MTQLAIKALAKRAEATYAEDRQKNESAQGSSAYDYLFVNSPTPCLRSRGRFGRKQNSLCSFRTRSGVSRPSSISALARIISPPDIPCGMLVRQDSPQPKQAA
jgi:hypothetical protein